MKQTAVEWLEEKLKENLKHIIINNDHVLMESFFLQAKELEKQQIIDAYLSGDIDAGMYAAIKKNAEQYYNETYKTK